jgi:hypothetical protein
VGGTGGEMNQALYAHTNNKRKRKRKKKNKSTNLLTTVNTPYNQNTNICGAFHPTSSYGTFFLSSPWDYLQDRPYPRSMKQTSTNTKKKLK